MIPQDGTVDAIDSITSADEVTMPVWENLLDMPSGSITVKERLVDFINVLIEDDKSQLQLIQEKVDGQFFGASDLSQNDRMLYLNVFRHFVPENKFLEPITESDIILDNDTVRSSLEDISNGVIAEAFYMFAIYEMLSQFNYFEIEEVKDILFVNGSYEINLKNYYALQIADKLNKDEGINIQLKQITANGFSSLVEYYLDFLKCVHNSSTSTTYGKVMIGGQSAANFNYVEFNINNDNDTVLYDAQRLLAHNLVSPSYSITSNESDNNTQGNFEKKIILVKQFLDSFHKIVNKLLDRRTTQFFNAIFEGENSLTNKFIAVGEGDQVGTKGFLNQKNWGVNLMNYHYKSEKFSNKDYLISSGKNTENEVSSGMGSRENTSIHFRVAALNSNNLDEKSLAILEVNFECEGTSVKLLFEGSLATNDGLRPKRTNIDSEYNYSVVETTPYPIEGSVEETEERRISFNEKTFTYNDVLDDSNITHFYLSNETASDTFGYFDRRNNDLVLTKDVENISFTLKAPGYSEQESDAFTNYDETSLFINVVKSTRVNNTETTTRVKVENFFEGDKFEGKRANIDSLRNRYSFLFEEIVDKLNFGYILNVTSLKGGFVSQWNAEEEVVEANPSYYPGTGGEAEDLIGKNANYSMLRFSDATIVLDPITRTINIEITSFVSPARSKLLYIYDSTTTDYSNSVCYDFSTTPVSILSNRSDLKNSIETDYCMSSYTLTNGEKSTNQLLAMLRSMGLLEAILYCLYIDNVDNVTIRSQIVSALSSARVTDETATLRGLSTDLQLPNPGSTVIDLDYNTYRSFKYYKSTIQNDYSSNDSDVKSNYYTDFNELID